MVVAGMQEAIQMTDESVKLFDSAEWFSPDRLCALYQRFWL